MYQGAVAGLYRWPVKSLRGERVDAARLDERGLVGDRAYALVDLRSNRAGKAVTVRQNQDTLAWSSRYPQRSGPAPAGTDAPLLSGPGGSVWSWDDPDLAGVLAEAFGIPLGLRAQPGQQDRGPTVLVTFEASRAGLASELGADVEIERFRPNVHLSVDAPAFAEESWGEGTAVRIGDVRLEVTGPGAGNCIRCAVPSWSPDGRQRWPELQRWLIERHENKFGLIMRAVAPGLVGAGDPVTVEPRAAG